jgi:hypothetical protein
MRTKALFSAAAALAVGALTAQAQVYSVNIVGYVNQATPGGAFNLVQNPLDDGTNTLSTVLAGAPNTSQAFVWNGAGYDLASVGAKSGVWGPDLAVPTGVGFFFKPAADFTNTYVGEVVAAPGESVTNSLTGGQIDLTGSLLPYGTASIATDTNFGLAGAPAGSQLFKWNGAAYDISSVGAKSGVWGPDRAIDVAESVFLNTSSDFDWVQTLPAN